MTCERIPEDIRENIVAWIDGELEAAAAEAVTRHVASCGPCQGLIAKLRATDRALETLGASTLAPRAGWLDQVEARIVAEGRTAPRRSGAALRWLKLRVVAPLLAAAGLLVAAGVGAWFFAPSHDAPSDQQLAPDGPAPRPETPIELPALPSPDQVLVEEVLEGPERDALPIEEVLPAKEPAPARPAEPIVVAELSPEELALVEDLDLLALLAEEEDLDLQGSLELLLELAPEELDDA